MRATISAGTGPLNIQPPGIDRLSLRMWSGNPVTDKTSALSTAANSILARGNELVVRAVELENQFTPIAEFATRFRKEILRELNPLRKINYNMYLIPA